VGRPIAGGKAAVHLQEIILPFKGKPEKYDLFTRKVILEDLAEGTPSGKLPYGLESPEQVHAELTRLNSFLAHRHPDVLGQFERRKMEWTGITDAYIEAMQALGFDPTARLSRENYFRHQILEHAEAKAVLGTGAGTRVPKGRSFLRQRKGSEKDISANYLEAEWEVMSQMIHDTQIAKFLKQVEASEHNIAPRLKAEAKEKGIEDWHTLIPDTHTTYQAQRGNRFYLAETIPERLVQEAFAEGLETVGVPRSQIREILAVGGKFREMALPKELALTLEGAGTRTRGQPGQGHLLQRGAFKGLRAWKQYQLINPKRIVNYNARNTTGDLEAVIRGNPKGLRQLPSPARSPRRATLRCGRSGAVRRDSCRRRRWATSTNCPGCCVLSRNPRVSIP
jgi:hypothetical protein